MGKHEKTFCPVTAYTVKWSGGTQRFSLVLPSIIKPLNAFITGAWSIVGLVRLTNRVWCEDSDTSFAEHRYDYRLLNTPLWCVSTKYSLALQYSDRENATKNTPAQHSVISYRTINCFT